MKATHPLAGRKQSPETIAKRMATRKTNLAIREAESKEKNATTTVATRRKGSIQSIDPSDISDAIHTLRRFRKIARSDNPNLEDMELLGRLALRMLEGGMK